MLKVKGVFKNLGRARVHALAEHHAEEIASVDMLLSEVFEEEAMDRAMEYDLNWLGEHLLSARARVAEFPLTIIKRMGGEALLKQPKIVIGTVHSVKGGESDEVVMFPDLSQQGMIQWYQDDAGRCAIKRMFYVGMTRAKWELHIAAPSSRLSVEVG